MKYDLVIPCAQKDYIKLPYCIEQCRKFLNPIPDNVYVVAKDLIRLNGVNFVQENLIFPFKYNDINYRRPQWIYQQIIKLCQDFTVNDNYFCVDADVLFTKQVNLFDGQKYKFFLTVPQYHQPYFTFMEKVFGLSRQVDHTFIADFTMFNKKYCREIIPDVLTFLNTLNNYISDDCLLGEPEVYGNYLAKNYPDTYVMEQLKVLQDGKHLPALYSRVEIEFMLNVFGQVYDYDAIMLHSWS